MAINPLIALQARNPDVGQAARGAFAGAQMLQNLQAGEQQSKALEQDISINDEKLSQIRSDRVARSIAQGAAVALPTLDSGDIEGTKGFLRRRAQELESFGRDASDTLDVLQKLESGDVDGARLDLQQAVQLGQVSGILQSGGPKYSNLKRTADGQLVGLNEKTGQIEMLPLPSGVTLADTTSKTEVNINKSEQAGLTEEQKALAKTRVGRFEELQQHALSAEEQNVGLTQIENIDVSTGFGEGAKSQLARAVNALGGNGAALTGVDPSNVQAFNAVAGKLVLDVMATQKGPQTDKDQERIAKTIPSIGNEKLANQFNVNSLKAINFRRIEMADFYERYLEEEGSLRGADRAWAKFKQETPLLSDQVKNPSTGLPMFFHEFKSKLMERNPGATEQQVLNAWRELTK